MNKIRYQRLVLAYAMVGILWIVGSDWLVGYFIGDVELSFDISVAKGVGFILVMSILLYVLLMKLNSTEIKASAAESVDQLFLSRIPEFFQSIPFVTYAIETDDRRVQPLWVSENIASVLGYSVSEALEPDWWSKNLHPEDRLRAVNEAKRIFELGGGDHYYRVKHANGTYLYIHDEMRAVDNKTPRRFVGIWHDVSIEEQAQQQVQHYSTRLEKAFLGTVSCIAGLVHDIGKISIPSEYLTKPTALTKNEYLILQTHPGNGYDILKNVDFPWPIAEVAHQHHERVDGSGYPNGLKGAEILQEARIVAVADVIESMATARPYRHAQGIDKALEEIENNAGRLYDPEVAAAAIKLFREKGYQLPLTV